MVALFLYTLILFLFGDSCGLARTGGDTYRPRGALCTYLARLELSAPPKLPRRLTRLGFYIPLPCPLRRSKE